MLHACFALPPAGDSSKLQFCGVREQIYAMPLDVTKLSSFIQLSKKKATEVLGIILTDLADVFYRLIGILRGSVLRLKNNANKSGRVRSCQVYMRKGKRPFTI